MEPDPDVRGRAEWDGCDENPAVSSYGPAQGTFANKRRARTEKRYLRVTRGETFSWVWDTF